MLNLNEPYYCEFRSSNKFNETGKTVTFQADIDTNYACQIRIYHYVDAYNINFINVPANSPGTYSITAEIPDNARFILYRVEPRNYDHDDAFCYTDNWRLIIS